jgi:hypothetical protein
MAPILLIIILVLLILGVLALIVARKNNKCLPDYYGMYIMGIIWMVVGIPMILRSENSAFFILGILFAAVGMKHRSEWNRNTRKWKDLSKEEKSLRMIIMIILGVLVLAGLVVFFLVKKGAI